MIEIPYCFQICLHFQGYFWKKRNTRGNVKYNNFPKLKYWRLMTSLSMKLVNLTYHAKVSIILR